jgi:hypothetical protein
MIRPATPASLAAAVRGRLEAELPGMALIERMVALHVWVCTFARHASLTYSIEVGHFLMKRKSRK